MKSKKKEGKIFGFIKNYLITNVWKDKKFIELMGDKWVKELHFEISTIKFQTNNKNQDLSTKVWVHIPIPHTNDQWTKNSFKLANELIKEFGGYYDHGLYQFERIDLPVSFIVYTIITICTFWYTEVYNRRTD